MGTRTARLLGKVPNVLVLCENSRKAGEISSILKSTLANDRYTIYDIRWDELAMGGWANQTALLVLSGKVPNPAEHLPILLQFLGDGGRLFAWGCESPPFGPTESNSIDVDDPSGKNRSVLNYASSRTHPVPLMKTLWGPPEDSSLPTGLLPTLETKDTDGNPRALTASVYAKVEGSNGTAIIIYDGGALGGKAVLSRVSFENSQDEESSLALLSGLLSESLGLDCTQSKSPEYTCGYLLGEESKVKGFLADIPKVIQQSELTIEFVPEGTEGSQPSQDTLPVKTLEYPEKFPTQDFFSNLKTKELGHLVIYSDVMASTMRLLKLGLKGHSLKHGIVAIANQQTSGKGRGKNNWISPEGCACFTVQVNLDRDSELGRRPGLIQLVAAMAVVQAIPNHKEISLRMKWPNDIYVGGNKVGGVLVESQLQAKTAVVSIGIGVNVSNDCPTICLNSFVGEGNKLTPAVLVARCLTQLELLIDQIQNGGLNQVLSMYTENWVHTGPAVEDVVKVKDKEEHEVKCRIIGVNESGFLKVAVVDSGHEIFVQPDGNSFDIANRLIAMNVGKIH